MLAGKATAKRDKCLDNVAPFWALLRAPSPSAPPNMEMQCVTLRDEAFNAMEGPKDLRANKNVQTTAEIPFAINTTNIEKGEILTLAFGEGPWRFDSAF